MAFLSAMHGGSIHFFVIMTVLRFAITFDIIRKESGDMESSLVCNQGTFIIRDDSTHSFYCAKSLAEAGCDLNFVSTSNVGFISNNKSQKKSFGITSPTGTICPRNYQSYVGDLYFQDYPSNIFKPVWTKSFGIKEINESLKFEYVHENMMRFEASTKDLSGVLLKIVIDCVDNENRLATEGAARRCVLVKYEGGLKFPLSASTFSSGGTISPKSSPINNSSAKIVAMTSDSNDVLIYAISAGVGCTFIIVAIFSTVAVICSTRKQRNRRSVEDGHPSEMSEPSIIQEIPKNNSKLKKSIMKPKVKKTAKDKTASGAEFFISPNLDTPNDSNVEANSMPIHSNGLTEFGDVYIGKLDDDLEDRNETIRHQKNNPVEVEQTIKRFTQTAKRKVRVKGLSNMTFESEKAIIPQESNQKADFQEISDVCGPKYKVYRHSNITKPMQSPSKSLGNHTPTSSIRESINSDFIRSSPLTNGSKKSKDIHESIRRTSANGFPNRHLMDGSVTESSVNGSIKESPVNDSVKEVQINNQRKKNSVTELLRSAAINGSIRSGSLYSSPTKRSISTPKHLQSVKRLRQKVKHADRADQIEISNRTKVYIEGSYPKDHPENLEATSESIEAMFSFSNELIEDDDHIDDNEEELADDDVYQINSNQYEETFDSDNNANMQEVDFSQYVDDLDAIQNAFPEDEEEFNFDSYKTLSHKHQKKKTLFSNQENSILLF